MLAVGGLGTAPDFLGHFCTYPEVAPLRIPRHGILPPQPRARRMGPWMIPAEPPPPTTWVRQVTGGGGVPGKLAMTFDAMSLS